MNDLGTCSEVSKEIDDLRNIVLEFEAVVNGYNGNND